VSEVVQVVLIVKTMRLPVDPDAVYCFVEDAVSVTFVL